MMIYKQRKKGLFNIMTGEYKNGWVQKEEAHTILGETQHEFITNFFLSSPNNDADGNLMGERTSYTGIHKSRFIKWL